jgi:acetolactate synthase I/II/III large subunit
VPTSHFNGGVFQELYRQYQADFPSTVRTMCKHVFQPTRGDMVPLAIRQAWKTMVTGRPGPVVLDVPFDVFKEPAGDEVPDPQIWSANISSRCGADPEGVREAADLLLAAERPVILVGQGVRYGGAAAELLTLAERLGIPVAASASGIGAIDAKHPGALGNGESRRALSGEPCRAAGGRAACVRRPLRRPHLELMAAGLTKKEMKQWN